MITEPMAESVPEAARRRERTRERAPRGRLLAVDVLRALAIFGMVWMHFVPTGWLEPTPPGHAWPGVLEWLNGFLDTRARSVFFLLAGVSVALMTGGARPFDGTAMRRARSRIAVRAGALLLLGLGLEQVSGKVNIITAYTGWLLFLLPWTRVRARRLFAAAGVFAMAAPVFQITRANWGQNWGFLPPVGPGAPELPQGLAVLVHPGDWLAVFQSYVFNVDTFYALPLLLAGLAIGRLDLYDRAVRVRMAITGAGIVVGGWLASWLVLGPLGLGVAIDRFQAELMAPPPMPPVPPVVGDGTLPDLPAAMPELPPMPKVPWAELWAMSKPGPGIAEYGALQIVWMVGVSLALLGGLLLLTERGLWQRVLWPLAAMGGMAMTWYFVQDVVTSRFLGRGPGGFGHAPQSLVPYALFAAAALVGSVLWRRFFRRGPLEALVHRVTAAAVPRSEG
ncbi:DUF418 domain-containing protein [Kitasatospora sp. NPDC057542]|uniref:DUF418 domain-containing protein n=1 Tax=Streptomycetaceae TaxID=2062 RepID=UPI001CCCE921|nr:DUF418 domain-containing protein [Streptomyces sp. LS1784]